MADHRASFCPKTAVSSTVSLALVLAAAGLAAFSSCALEKTFGPQGRRGPFVPPAAYMEVLCGSQRGACAGLFYVRGILALTDDADSALAAMEWAQKNFDTALHLDPRLVQAYFFAGVVAARDRQRLYRGIDFLKSGMSRLPDEWQIPYWIGFNYYQLGEHLAAAEYFEKAAACPQAPAFLKGIQPMMFYRAGRPDLGVVFLQGLKSSVKETRQLAAIERKLAWLQNLIMLEERVGAFRTRFGRLPGGLDELVSSGLIGRVPDDVFGTGYYLDQNSGRVQSGFKGD